MRRERVESLSIDHVTSVVHEKSPQVSILITSYLTIMIVRITGISIDDSPLTMKPFLTEIPDREIGWDLGHDHMEMYVCNQDDFLDQFDPNNYTKFSFDFEHVEVHEINGEPFR